MIASLLSIIGNFIISTIATLGYPGVVVLMGIESACIPLPSEVIMPFSGYLVYKNHFTLLAVSLAGTLGCVFGSIVAYYAGLIGGRPVIERYGKYVLISAKDLEWAEKWFLKHGESTIFFSRLLPVIRTFISFPAGVAKMHLPKFILYTALGSFPWCLGLAYGGKLLGENWILVEVYFHKLDLLIGILLLLGVIFFVWRHIKIRRLS